MTTQELQITGMSCAACAAAVEQSLRQVPGVKTCWVNLATDRARIDYDDRQNRFAQPAAGGDGSGLWCHSFR